MNVIRKVHEATDHSLVKWQAVLLGKDPSGDEIIMNLVYLASPQGRHLAYDDRTMRQLSDRFHNISSTTLLNAHGWIQGNGYISEITVSTTMMPVEPRQHMLEDARCPK